MTNFTQTPGPWIAHKYPTKRGYGFVIQSEEHRGISIASLSPGISTDRIEPIAEANAHLIAAAPDLLEALEDAVEALTQARYYPSELKRFKAAIAKAKGQ